MKASHILSLFTTASVAHGWSPNPAFGLLVRSTTSLAASVPDADNPCWQDLYDDDCSMNSAFSASFVAGEWIKSMPCASGVEDCDMPEDLKVPDARPGAGVEQVDVMGFLGIKRPQPL